MIISIKMINIEIIIQKILNLLISFKLMRDFYNQMKKNKKTKVVLIKNIIKLKLKNPY